MKLKIKDEFIGKKVSQRHLAVDLNEINENEYQFYYKNGFSFLFEEEKDEIIKQVEDYINETDKQK